MNARIVIASPAAGQSLPTRGGRQFFALFANKSKSPGRTSALSRSPSFSRRQAVGVVVYLNTVTPAAIKIVGAISRPLRSLFSHAPAHVCQDRRRCVSKKYPVLFCMFAHVEQHAGEALKCLTRVLSRVPR